MEAVPGRPGHVLRRPRRRERRARQGVRRQRRGKKQLLVEAEALLPVTDLEAAKRAFRDIAERWDAAGKVPARPDEGRSRPGSARSSRPSAALEDEQWRRSDPEKSARADDMVSKLQQAIEKVEADLDKARAAGNEKRVRDLEENLESRRAFLETARRASDEFSG